MTDNNLRKWVDGHFFEPRWTDDRNHADVACPFHVGTGNECTCYINIPTRQFYCDTSDVPEHIQVLFEFFDEEYPEEDDCCQISCYDYTDAEGKPVVMVREEILEDGTVHYKRSPSGVKKRVLYNLPMVLSQLKNDGVVVWLMGEKRVKQLKRFGITATTTIGGYNEQAILKAVEDLPPSSKILVVESNHPSHKKYFSIVRAILRTKRHRVAFISEDALDLRNERYWSFAGDYKIGQIYTYRLGLAPIIPETTDIREYTDLMLEMIWKMRMQILDRVNT